MLDVVGGVEALVDPWGSAKWIVHVSLGYLQGILTPLIIVMSGLLQYRCPLCFVL
jgi:hypothetical protein